MKKYLSIFIVLILVLSGCRSTRNVVKTSEDSKIVSESETKASSASQSSSAMTTTETTTDFSTAVIEFVKTEYFDGSVKTDTTSKQGCETFAKTRDRESTEPPNAGIKSVTTGKITLNNDKTQSTQTDVSASESSIDLSSTDETTNEQSSSDIKSEEKDIRGTLYYLAIIIGSIAMIVLLIYVVRACRKEKADICNFY